MFWAAGKIPLIAIRDVGSKQVANIPFHVAGHAQGAGSGALPAAVVAPETFDVKMLRWVERLSLAATRSSSRPSATSISVDLPNGYAAAFDETDRSLFEFYPTWSRDGRGVDRLRDFRG